ncbi:MAG: hypothetical protein CMA10_04470 [Euryarchaeota archaeon]|nr:hypothetical protein [Euryarchaeota archaeon]
MLVPQNATKAVKLTFNNPLKYLCWTYSPTKEITTSAGQAGFASENEQLTLYNSVETSYDLKLLDAKNVKTVNLTVNGNNRFGRDERSEKYFRTVAPYLTFDKAPKDPLHNAYSFARHPLAVQPSGSLNASKINDFIMTFKASGTLSAHIYGVSQNIFKVTGGTGGNLYA